MEGKKITTDDLAAMIQKGFESTAQKADVDKRFDAVDARLGVIGERLDGIEKLILADHKRRIERLEDEMKDLKGLLAIK